MIDITVPLIVVGVLLFPAYHAIGIALVAVGLVIIGIRVFRRHT